MAEEIQAFSEEYFESHLRITLDIYQQILLDVSANYVFCPFGIFTSLCMLAAGAENNTGVQFQKLLQVDSSKTDSKIHAFLKILLESLQISTPDMTFHMGNGLFIQNEFPIQSDFQKIVETHYSTQIKQERFDGNNQEVSTRINDWVKSESKDKIKAVIDAKDLDEYTRLILLTVVYFKSQWKNKFEKSKTIDDYFSLLNGQKVKMPMMEQTSRLRIGRCDDLGISALEIPYAGDVDMSMIIILPNSNDGLYHVEKKLRVNVMKEITDSLHPALVNVKLPKFQIESSTSLKKYLSALGLTDVFNEQHANLSKLATADKLFVSIMQQQSMIEVDEEGTEAAAATAVHIRRSRSAIDEENFHAHHPFLFYIQERRSGFLFFLGRFVGPQVEISSTKDEL